MRKAQPPQDEAQAREALRSWFADEAVALQPLGEGHIHSTWQVALPERESPGVPRYVLQKINQAVFAEPSVVMSNLQTLFADTDGRSPAALDYVLPEPLVTLAGGLLASSGTERLPDGEVVASQWRLASYVEQSRSLQTLSSAQQAEAAGRAFGEFQHWLGCLGDASIAAVIPGFHDLPGYVQGLSQAEAARRGELTAAEQQLLAQLHARDYVGDAGSGSAGHGVIHGDCKINNLLFAREEDRVVAILDLDTLMRAPWWLDFGDLVRSATCTDAGEFQREFYPALVSGFFTGRGGDTGVAPMGFRLADALRAPAHVTYMLAIRFLTDHLQNDSYFRVVQRGDNLRRAQRQFRLLQSLEGAETAAYMREVLGRYF